MTRLITSLLLVVVLSGCIHGLAGRDVFQADGVLVELRVTGVAATVAGELLVVDADALLIDALGPDGRPQRVVRVSRSTIAEGAVYAGTSGGRWAVTDEVPPPGTRRIARLTSGGTPDGRLDLRLLSRFPHGLSDALLGALLERRGQSAVAPVPDAP
jgi:hypothetical protein